MGIFSRISDIINANINVLLDSAENPEKMVRLMIQEMEETLVEVRTSSARIIADKKELSRRNQRFEQQVQEWQFKAELALSKGREDLAKAALVEKSNLNDIIAAAEEDMGKLDETLARLTDEIEQLQVKLNDAKARQKTMAMRTRATESRASVNRRLNDGKFDKAMHKMDYFERKIEAMESQIEADAIGRNNLHSEFQQLQMEDKIDSELQALKAKLQAAKQGDGATP